MSRRFLFLISCGAILVIGGLLIRHSRWAEERELKRFSAEDLAYLVHDRPQDPLAFLYYGISLLKNRDIPDAKYAFQRTIKLDPTMYRAYMYLGDIQMHEGDYAAAQTNFQKACALQPNNTAPFLALAQADYALGLVAHSETPLKKLVQLKPRNATYWYLLGRAYGDAHEPDKALTAMQQAVKLDPTKSQYWQDLAQLSIHYARFADAEKQLKAAIHCDPLDSWSYYLLGYVYANEGDTPALRGLAEKCFLLALTRNPNFNSAYFQLGQLYERHGQYEIASANYRKAFHLAPSDDQALYHLGLCLVRMGQVQQGQKLISGAQALQKAERDINYLLKRIVAQPQDPDLRLRLARTYRKYGDYDDALFEYRVYASLVKNLQPSILNEIITCSRLLNKQSHIRKFHSSTLHQNDEIHS
ncbi:MAG TPA: tetratricopeptide repeat protein [Chthonomonas sp.]|uniref:tetratricopeptide repeat protein n=1 Tax=Chthonomonas sp. TaxID=2282153 RepID=UPI002B4B81C5|nr:tetratricopeptide repeat protein [Chthonomonas sp.]HLI47893.1 tetratricopeptide repeat protein [Chthonomonas sp.]